MKNDTAMDVNQAAEQEEGPTKCITEDVAVCCTLTAEASTLIYMIYLCQVEFQCMITYIDIEGMHKRLFFFEECE